MIAAPPSTPGTRIPVPQPGTGGSWIVPVIILSVMIWTAFQLTPGGRAKWKRRWDLMAPLLSVVVSDISYLIVRPIVTRVTVWRFRRQLGDR